MDNKLNYVTALAIDTLVELTINQRVDWKKDDGFGCGYVADYHGTKIVLKPDYITFDGHTVNNDRETVAALYQMVFELVVLVPFVSNAVQDYLDVVGF